MVEPTVGTFDPLGEGVAVNALGELVLPTPVGVVPGASATWSGDGLRRAAKKTIEIPMSVNARHPQAMIIRLRIEID
jgi:hypothetical protein